MIKTLLLVPLLIPLNVLPSNIPQPVTQVPHKEIDCLAEAIYHEARGEPLKGQLAVAYVIINRVKSHKFPPTACAVVRQPGQFTYKHTKNKVPHKYKALAYSALTKPYKFKALYFHSVKISPGWNKRKYAKIGNHIFYV